MRNLRIFIFLFFSLMTAISCDNTRIEEAKVIQTSTDVVPTIKEQLFGFDLAEYEVDFDTVKNGMNWNDLFRAFDVSQYTINSTVERLKDSLFNLKYIIAGKPFLTFTAKSQNEPSHLVYEPDVFSYIVFNIKGDSIRVEKEDRPISIEERVVTGVIEQNSNLSAEINKKFDSYNMTAELASYLEGVYAWSIDFFRLQPNDKFIIVYDEKIVDGKPYGVDKIKYTWFEHSGTGLYAFNYIDSAADITGYYNEKGEEMKRPFLKAPVQYSRISSSFNLGRFHPVLKRTKAHLGTDYAAPTGTPIYSTADGTVIAARHSKYNGNYVKIRHNQTYDTQYLHMSRIADGMRPGVRVKQGQTIGFVGQTGLATGPHVCYRFWKNGKQIDPRSEKFPQSEPMKKEAIPTYLEFIAPLKETLDKEISTLKEKAALSDQMQEPEL